MAIRGAKTIAEYAVRKWMESNSFAMECFDLEVCGHEAIIRDSSGDSMRLVYDPSSRRVLVLE